MKPRGVVRRLLHKILVVQMTHPRVVLACALALAAGSALYTLTCLGFLTSQSALVSQDNRSIELLRQTERFSELDAFVVAVENTDTAKTLRFVRKLVPRLEADKKNFEQVFARVDPARLRQWQLLYLKENEIAALGASLKDHEDFLKTIAQDPGLVGFFREINRQTTSSMVDELFTGFLALEPAEKGSPMNLDFLVQFLKQLKAGVEGSRAYASPWTSFFIRDGWINEAEEGYFWTEGRKYLLVFVKPVTKVDGISDGAHSLTALRGAVAGTETEFPGIVAGVTGQKALDEDERETALGGMEYSTVIALICLAALLVVFWRGVKRPMLEITVLITALCITFGLTTLFIGHLNLLSVAFAPMLLGLGIDYGVHWFARFAEERQHPGTSTRKALEVTMGHVGPAILLAGVCASLSFLPLTLTGFTGLAELGIICAMGLAVSTLATLGLLPALILLFDKHKPVPAARGKEAPLDVRLLLRTNRRVSLIIVAVGVLTAAFSLWGASKMRFDLNLLNLQSKNAESVIWEKRLIEASRYPSINGAVFAHSREEVEEKSRALEKLPTVAEVRTIFGVLPPDQERKLALLRQMLPLLKGIRSIPMPKGPVDVGALDDVLGRLKFKLGDAGADTGIPSSVQKQMRQVGALIDAIKKDFVTISQATLVARLDWFQRRMVADLNDKLSLLYSNMETRPMHISDLPKPVRDRFVGPDSLYLIRVFPKGNIWDPAFLSAFVRDMQSVDPDATGDPVTLNIFTKAFRDASIKAAIYAVVFILVFLGLTLRSPIAILAALSPLVVGTLWTFGLMYLLKVNLNLANSIFLPLVLGAGVEYGVIVVQRWRYRKPYQGGWNLPLSTGMGVILAGLTTTLGFSSLILSGHQGIKSLGMLSTVGSVTVLVAAVILLPAFLYLVSASRSRQNKQKEPENNPGALYEEEERDEDQNPPRAMGSRNPRNTTMPG